MALMETFLKLVFICCLMRTILCQNIETQDDIIKLSRANAYFAEKLYKQLSKNTTNLICSPLSISIALSMLSVGAGGTSFQELNSTLGFQFAQLNEQELLRGYQNMVTRLTEPGEGHVISVANAQFIQNSFPIYTNYTSILVDDFHAETNQVDFANKQETLATINGWAKTATNGKIESILEDVTPDDVMALLNAVYFKGKWQYEFNENQTLTTDFTAENGTRKTVKMMTQQMTAKYNRNHQIGASVLELPYKGNSFSLILILPNHGSNLAGLEPSLTPEALLTISEDLTERKVNVGIPKIKLESSIDLIGELEEMGVREIFNSLADLHRISSVHLEVSQVKHKAIMEINEEGSEAAAVTAVVTSVRTGPAMPIFWADHPFLFILRHNPTNTVAFLGKVADV